MAWLSMVPLPFRAFIENARFRWWRVKGPTVFCFICFIALHPMNAACTALRSGPPLWSTFDAPPQRVGDDEVVEEPQADRLGGFHEAARGHQVGVAGMQ